MRRITRRTSKIILPLTILLITVIFLFTISFQGKPSSPISMSSSSSEDLSCDSPICYNYVFSTFGGETSKNERQLDIYVSDDAVHWEALAVGTYKPANSLLRDPSIILHSDGFYYICHTTDWDGDDFAIIRSKNLIDWDPVVTVKSSHNGFQVAQTWAPEFFQDPQTNKIHIIVSLRQPDLTLINPDHVVRESIFKPYIFTATSSDLESWSRAQQLNVNESDEGLLQSHIDMFVIYKEDDKSTPYHAFMKNEVEKYVEHLTATSVMGPWEYKQTNDFANWGIKEGPVVVQLPSGKYRIWADDYHGHYQYADSDDLWTWNEMVDIPDGISSKVRHGSVLRQVK